MLGRLLASIGALRRIGATYGPTRTTSADCGGAARPSRERCPVAALICTASETSTRSSKGYRVAVVRNLRATTALHPVGDTPES